MSVNLREKKLADGRRSLYLDIYEGGRRAYEFLQIYLTGNKSQDKESKELAQNIRAKRQLEIKSTVNGFTPEFKKKVNFREYFEKVLETKKKFEGLRGASTWKQALKYIDSFTGNQGIQIGAIDEKWLEEFKQSLLKTLRPNSANNVYGKIKTVLRKAVKEGFISRNPSENVKYFPAVETERAYLTTEEIQVLANTPCKRPDLKRAFLFGCFTGLRVGDIRALTWRDIKDGKIHFRQKKTQGFEYLDLNPTALKLINQCKAPDELPHPEKPIFNIPDKSHIAMHLSPWIKTSGIKKKITFHSSRHTFATGLLTAGADLYTTSKLLGHKSIQSTAIYAKIVDEKKRSAVNSLPEIEVTA